MKTFDLKKYLVENKLTKTSQLGEDEPIKYIGKKVDHPIATEAAKEAALNSSFAPNQHYIFEKGFLAGIKWLEDKK